MIIITHLLVFIAGWLLGAKLTRSATLREAEMDYMDACTLDTIDSREEWLE